MRSGHFMLGSFRLRQTDWPLPASLVAHAAVLAALLWAGMPRMPPPPPERPIAVDILSQDQFDALTRPKPAPVMPPPMLASPLPALGSAASAPAASAPPQPARPETIEATKFFAAGILADPANREIAETLPLLAGDEQVIQLCNMEALEQLRVADMAERPDTVVGYAYGDMTVAGATLTANGGAFRSQGHWFHVQYHCTASAEARAVSAFDFTVGDAIPQSEWEEHALNANDEGLD